MHILLANFSKMANDSGGLAKVTCAFANEMIAKGHKVTLIYSDENMGKFFYHLNESVAVYNLRESQDGSIIKFPFHLKVVRELLRFTNKRLGRTINNYFNEKYLLGNLKNILHNIKLDVIVCSQPSSSKMLLCDLNIETPTVTMSHGDPSDYFCTYPKAEIPSLEKSTVCQVLVPSFEKHITNVLPKAKTITIGNAIPQYEFSADLEADKEQYKIAFVGRLTKNHKQPHLLIEAFAKIADRHPNWIVELWGAKDRATYYAELKHLIKNNGLDDKVFLNGTTNNVAEVLKSADIFAFPSAYEGFGLALAEAMSTGLPAVGFKSCSRVNELIVDGENGLLCDDGVESFAEALDKLMSSKDLRVKMGKAAKESMKQFAPEAIWNKWEALLESIK